MSDPLEVSVSVPEDTQLTEQEKADLKESFRATVVERLEARGLVDPEVHVEVVMGGGG